MSGTDIVFFVLRIAHAAAAVIWLGGGVYFVVGILPQLSSQHPTDRRVAAVAQQAFGSWSRDATAVLLITGMILMFDRLSTGTGGLTYAALLALKVISAALAFILVSSRVRQRRLTSLLPPDIRSTITVMIFAWLAFAIGIGLASYYGRGLS